MTSPRRFEMDLPARLSDLYMGGTPDYRDDLVRLTARTRQRHAWTFPERWLPMDIAARSIPKPSIAWRTIAVLVVIGTLVALAVGAIVGS